MQVHKSFSDVPDSDVNIVFGWAAGTDTAAQVDEFVYCFSRLIRKHEAPALPPSFAAALYTLRTLNREAVLSSVPQRKKSALRTKEACPAYFRMWTLKADRALGFEN
ncbi:hypothetical protein CSKR_110174 [Clonorchis sinensis]|uniref:Uncharacterized protein n=1 Tax=Clonorchis sinensis TaxID=79923 RepID=A0A419PLA5_CLOSI|nr:hypothetical protein CSKR_110174 [Clonorchis sinensis]